MRVRNEPTTISMAWKIKSADLRKAGAIDVLINSDTNLFIDPVLLGEATNKKFRESATRLYRTRFEEIIKLLSHAKDSDDVAWKAAQRLFSFHEIGYTHLGYSKGTSGSGIGKQISGEIFKNAKRVIELGITDPDLFMVLAFLEEGVGADRISDMTTNIILESLCEFTLEVCKKLKVATQSFEIANRHYHLPPNPLKLDEPIILVPRDVVKDLPIASDWDGIASAARQTEELRDRVNKNVGEIWSAKTRKQKKIIRKNALHSKESFETVIELLHMASDAPYDLNNDMKGEIYPADVRSEIGRKFPLDLSTYANVTPTKKAITAVVEKIINKFTDLVENNGLWKELWDQGLTRPRNEKAAQRLFFAVASSYCDANDLDISPESDSGCGPVDFKFSSGAKSKVLVEIKKSNNSKLIDGYAKQLEAYKRAEKPLHSHYVVIDVGGLNPTKTKGLSNLHSAFVKIHGSASDIDYVDGGVQKSASKR